MRGETKQICHRVSLSHMSCQREPCRTGRSDASPCAGLMDVVGPRGCRRVGRRDLATILRTYRRLNGISQPRLADILGYDKTYVSMIETGRRSINDVGTRRHIARTLGLPTHVFGVTDGGDADFAA